MDPNPYAAPRHHQEPLPKDLPLEIAAGPLTVEYELTVDDYVAFNVSHHARGALPTWTRKILEVLGYVTVPLAVLCYLGAAWAGWFEAPIDMELVASLLLFVGIYLVIYPLMMWWALAKLRKPEFGQYMLRYYLKRRLSSGDHSSVLGHRRVTISPTALYEQGNQCETTYKISAVQKMLVTDQYLFVYVSPLQAFIIPNRAFLSPHDFDFFVRTLEAWTGRTAAR